jgi:hypothetical protein
MTRACQPDWTETSDCNGVEFLRPIEPPRSSDLINSLKILLPVPGIWQLHQFFVRIRVGRVLAVASAIEHDRLSAHHPSSLRQPPLPVYLVATSSCCTQELKEYVLARLLQFHGEGALPQAQCIIAMIIRKEVRCPWADMNLDSLTMEEENIRSLLSW